MEYRSAIALYLSTDYVVRHGDGVDFGKPTQEVLDYIVTRARDHIESYRRANVHPRVCADDIPGTGLVIDVGVKYTGSGSDTILGDPLAKVGWPIVPPKALEGSKAEKRAILYDEWMTPRGCPGFIARQKIREMGLNNTWDRSSNAWVEPFPRQMPPVVEDGGETSTSTLDQRIRRMNTTHANNPLRARRPVQNAASVFVEEIGIGLPTESARQALEAFSNGSRRLDIQWNTATETSFTVSEPEEF